MPPILRPLSDNPFGHRALELISAARDARLMAYAPYSGFSVGAAILTDTDIFVGVNVEAVDYDVTHAEESALSAMRMSGWGDFRMIVAVGAKGGVPSAEAPVIPPCGKCRQKIYEWIRTSSTRDIDVVVSDPTTREPRLCSIRELLPLTFG